MDFRGALDCGAKEINGATKLAAAEALAVLVEPEELSKERVIPSVFDLRVAGTVAQCVVEAAVKSGAVRK